MLIPHLGYSCILVLYQIENVRKKFSECAMTYPAIISERGIQSVTDLDDYFQKMAKGS